MRIREKDQAAAKAAAGAPWTQSGLVFMRILRHAQIDVTMNVYTKVSDAKTLKALKRLGKQLGE